VPRQGYKRPPVSPEVQKQTNKAVQPIRVPTGQPQGERQASVQAQKAMPLPDETDPMAALLDAAGGFDATDGITPMGAPSMRPNEPTTAGLPIGAGAGPPMGGIAAAPDPVTYLEALYARYPSSELRHFIDDARQTAAPVI
jgi:hypothetical protein